MQRHHQVAPAVHHDMTLHLIEVEHCRHAQLCMVRAESANVFIITASCQACLSVSADMARKSFHAQQHSNASPTKQMRGRKLPSSSVPHGFATTAVHSKQAHLRSNDAWAANAVFLCTCKCQDLSRRQCRCRTRSACVAESDEDTVTRGTGRGAEARVLRCELPTTNRMVHTLK